MKTQSRPDEAVATPPKADPCMHHIIALCHLDNRPIDRGHLRSMTQAIRCPEPREHHLWPSPSELSHVALGHTSARSTIDENHGEQGPITSMEDKVTLTATARLDNRDELYTRLGIAASQGDLIPDSRLIMMSYRYWGLSCTRYLIGGFAFVLWDARRRRLVCARDHMGERQLFYSRAGNLLAIASSLKALLAIPGTERTLNLTKVAEFLVLSGNPDAAFYDSVRRLPPAHTLVATRHKVALQPYWSPLRKQRVRLACDREYVDRFREIFDTAVADRLRGHSRIGLFLSGGLDSSAVAASASALLAEDGRRLSSFTAVPPGQDYKAPPRRGWYNDETPYIEAIRALHPNIDANYVPYPTHGLPFLSDDLVSLTEAPPLNPDAVPWIEAILGSARSQGIRLLLTGQAGNTTISYSGRELLPRLAITGRWLRLAHEMRCLAADRPGKMRQILKRQVLKPMLPNWLVRLYGQWAGTFPTYPWQAFSLVNPDFARQRIHRRAHYFPKDGHLSSRSLRVAILTSALYEDHHDLVAAWSSRYGIELRDPTRDKRVVEFCLSIPDDQYLRDGQDRRLIRRAMQGLLPAQVTKSTLRGLQQPDWLHLLTGVRPQIFELLAQLERSELARACLDLPRMRNLIEHWPKAEESYRARVIQEYRCALQRGLMMGRFLLWHERS
jgi:asparagine synthase (glutamine-hydrolysing)